MSASTISDNGSANTFSSLLLGSLFPDVLMCHENVWLKSGISHFEHIPALMDQMKQAANSLGCPDDCKRIIDEAVSSWKESFESEMHNKLLGALESFGSEGSGPGVFDELGLKEARDPETIESADELRRLIIIKSPFMKELESLLLAVADSIWDKGVSVWFSLGVHAGFLKNSRLKFLPEDILQHALVLGYVPDEQQPWGLWLRKLQGDCSRLPIAEEASEHLNIPPETELEQSAAAEIGEKILCDLKRAAGHYDSQHMKPADGLLPVDEGVSFSGEKTITCWFDDSDGMVYIQVGSDTEPQSIEVASNKGLGPAKLYRPLRELADRLRKDLDFSPDQRKADVEMGWIKVADLFEDSAEGDPQGGRQNTPSKNRQRIGRLRNALREMQLPDAKGLEDLLRVSSITRTKPPRVRLEGRVLTEHWNLVIRDDSPDHST